MTADAYTSPEMSAERRAAGRVRKRIDADRRKLGNCCICIRREVTFDRPHCINRPERQMGQCEFDGKLPKFEVDPASLEKYRDAA